MANQKEQAGSEKFLWLGVVIGALGFLSTLVWDDLSKNLDRENEGSVVAKVNDIEIEQANYVNQLKALAEGKRNRLKNRDADLVLTRIIEEELLVQRGLEVRLPELDRQTRASIVASMISMVTADAKSYQPTDEELQAFYRDNISYFSQPARARVRKLDILTANAGEMAQQLAEALSNGQSLDTLLSSEVILDLYLPNTLLPALKVREYLGPKQTLALLDAPIGEALIWWQTQDKVSLLYLAEKQASTPRPYAEVEKLVASEFSRRRADQALQDYLVWLKQRADIQVYSQAVLVE